MPIFDDFDRAIREHLNQIIAGWVARQHAEVRRVIAQHDLFGSFMDHLAAQVRSSDGIKVGVVDTFGVRSHGDNVAIRLVGATPGYGLTSGCYRAVGRRIMWTFPRRVENPMGQCKHRGVDSW